MPIWPDFQAANGMAYGSRTPHVTANKQWINRSLQCLKVHHNVQLLNYSVYVNVKNCKFNLQVLDILPVHFQANRL